MRVLIAALVLMVPGVGIAQDLPVWAGYWSEDASWCVRAGEPGDEVPEYIAPDGIFGIEYSCEFVSVAPIGVGQSWRVKLTCLDAGFEETLSEIFVVTNEDKLLRIGADGWVVSQHRCSKPVTE